MVQISKSKLEERVLERIFSLFFEVVGKRKSKEEFELMTHLLLSKPERMMIGKRIGLIYLLLKGIDIATICHVLKITRATAAKYSILLERTDDETMTFKKIIRNDKLKDFFLEVFTDIYGPGVVGANWSAAWERKKIINEKKQYGI